MTDYSKLFDGISMLIDEPMSKHTTFRIGGTADCVLLPSSSEELTNVLKTLSVNGIKPIIIGNGSNILVSDNGVRGVVIKLTDNMSDIIVKGNDIICQSGVSLSKLCLVALENSLTGVEGLYGIPGSVGGAVYMNAGAYGYEIKDVITKTEYLDANGNKCEYLGNEGFSYRKSPFSDNDYVIIGATFHLEKGNKEEIKEKMDDVKKRRADKQPLNFPSAGSTFKRPEGYYAAALIEQSGLKGKKVGDAMVSDKHSGFIVNLGKATAVDVLSLVQIVQNTVKEDFGVELETEIRYLGE